MKIAKTLLAAALFVASAPFNAPRAVEAGGVDVCFQFAHTPAPMVIGRAATLPEAVRMVTQVAGIDESASDEDRYVLRDHGTSQELLTLNLRGLRALQAK
jgi:hypothetical protein